MTHVLTVQELRKRYGALQAVDGLSFAVEEGSIYCLVGPNGAGKTTTVECIEGLRQPDSGAIRVLGLDPAADRTRMYQQVGVQFQENSLYSNIRPREALRLFASMYDEPRPVDDLLTTFDLAKRANTAYKHLSGGEKRKLLAAIALVGTPRLLILDEPTSGLDPHARRDFWATLRGFREQGLTILLTTHDMREAEDHSDVIGIVEHGTIIAEGAPRQLLQQHGLATRIAVPVNGKNLDDGALNDMVDITSVERQRSQVLLYGATDAFMTSATTALQHRGISHYTIRPATIEDLYLRLTGHDYQSKEAS